VPPEAEVFALDPPWLASELSLPDEPAPPPGLVPFFWLEQPAAAQNGIVARRNSDERERMGNSFAYRAPHRSDC
jgi:hypothetical protein